MRKMRQNLRYYLYKFIGTVSFIRLIEWKIILRLVHSHKKRICDVACGGGSLSLKLAERQFEVHAVDISKDVILKALDLSKLVNINCIFVIGDALNLPYRSESFDIVVCNSSLEHFLNDIKALKEAYRILKPNGFLILTVDSLSYIRISNKFKERHRKLFLVKNYYNKDNMKDKLEKTNFEVVYIRYYLNSFLSFLFYKLAMRFRKYGFINLVMLPIAYPLCIFSDRLFGTKNGGCGLVLKARKKRSW